MADDDLDAILFEMNKDVPSGAEIKKSFVPDRKSEHKSPWTSLEIAKIIVGALTPLLIAGFGWYATNQSHEQDLARIARDDLKTRKASAEPLIQDLLSKYDDYRQAQLNEFATLQAALLMKEPVKAAPYIFRDHIHANSEIFRRQHAEDWAKLRALIDDDTKFNQLNAWSRFGIIAESVDATDKCSRTLVNEVTQNVVDEARLGEMMSCQMKSTINECYRALYDLLEHFERPIADDKKKSMDRTCHAVFASSREPSSSPPKSASH